MFAPPETMKYTTLEANQSHDFKSPFSLHGWALYLDGKLDALHYSLSGLRCTPSWDFRPLRLITVNYHLMQIALAQLKVCFVSHEVVPKLFVITRYGALPFLMIRVTAMTSLLIKYGCHLLNCYICLSDLFEPW